MFDVRPESISNANGVYRFFMTIQFECDRGISWFVFGHAPRNLSVTYMSMNRIETRKFKNYAKRSKTEKHKRFDFEPYILTCLAAAVYTTFKLTMIFPGFPNLVKRSSGSFQHFLGRHGDPKNRRASIVGSSNS